MAMRRMLRRGLLAVLVAVGAVGLAWSQSPEGSGTGKLALMAAVEGPIGPGTLRHVEDAVETARERNAEVLVLRLDTPGGLASSMRQIISEILGSSVPVVGWVAPPGAHAASAGTYILYATHVAAMAPATNLGAATPVQIGGGGLPGSPSPDEKQPKDGKGDNGDAAKEDGGGGKTAMEKKAVNDAVALIRSLAEKHGRNAEWAEEAVREGASLSAKAALEKGVIDLLADDVDDLLAKLNGRTVIAGSAERTLATEGLRVERLEPDFLTEALGVLSNPNVALILMMIGVYGLLFEFINPGSIGPGVVGAICLVLALFALNQLPIDYAGLALVVLGIGFMVAEALTPAFGVLAGGGLIAFVIGAAMLIDTEEPAYQVSWWVIGGTAVVSAAVLVGLLGYTWRVYRRPGRKRDASRMLDTQATVLDWSGEAGHVHAEGERWSARGPADLQEGESVRVRELHGLTLVVGRDGEADQTGSRQPARDTRAQGG